VRVRTYGFPGCFTRPPGTSTRNHPHEPTTSKPVVPVDALRLQCTAGAAHSGGTRRTTADKKRRGPKPLEEPAGIGRKAFPDGWRGLTPQWPRSLRLGPASEFKVARASRSCKSAGRSIPHPPEKSRTDARSHTNARVRVRRGGAQRCARALGTT
jgi:hypothetical protein